jgi:hypothetical protein
MKINSIKLVGQNITTVYESIKIEDIETREFKKILESRPVVTEIPEMIAFFWPQEGPIILQIADNRIRISRQTQTEELDDLSKLAISAHSFLPDPCLIAYGFNYEWFFNLTPDTGSDLTLKLFDDNLTQIASICGGPIVRFTPRFSFKVDDILFECALEPVDEHGLLHVFANAHHNSATLPDNQVLDDQYHRNYEYLRSIINTLVEKS